MNRYHFLTTIFLTAVHLAFIFGVSPSSAATQVADTNSPKYQDGNIRFERISNEQGLSMSVVQAIAQDPRGFLWFATQDGLNRYDGYRFKIYKNDETDANSLSANWVNTLLVDPAGALWIGTQRGGLNRLDLSTGRIRRYPFATKSSTGLSGNSVHSLHLDRSGRLWIGTDRGVEVLGRNGVLTHLHNTPEAPDGLKEWAVRALLEDRQGLVWLGTSGGLVRFNPVDQTFLLFQHSGDDPNSLAHDAVMTLLEDRQGRIWVGTRGGLDRFDPSVSSFKHYSTEGKPGEALSSDVVMDLFEDAEGLIWIATWEGGLNQLDPSTGKISIFRSEPQDPHSLSSNHLHTIFADESGLVWIGTWGGGLSRFDPASEQFLHYYSKPLDPNSLSSNMVWDIYEDHGILWVGTVDGLDRLDRSSGDIRHYRHSADDPTGLPANSITSIHRDTHDQLWISTDGGLSRYDPEQDRFFTYAFNPEGENEARITAVADADNGQLWIGSKNGIFLFSPKDGSFTATAASGMSGNSPPVYALLQTADRLWVGRQDGLFWLDPTADSAGQKASLKETQVTAQIIAISPDPSGALWLGSIGSGLVRYDPVSGSVSTLRERDGMPNDTVYGILEDENGSLWMSTNKGLARYDPRSANIQTYSAYNGLQSNEFNSNAYHRSPSGEMFFGGINGVTAFYPQNIHENTYLPPVVLTSLTQNGQSFQGAQTTENLSEISFSWPDNFFEFEMAALSFRQPEQNQYAYMLEGYDRDWVYTGNNRFGRYTSLPGGNYRLRIKAANNDGVWNETGASVAFFLYPPFWQTWSFRLGMGIALALVVVAGYRARLRSIERNNRELSRQVKERTYEIERRHQELEALYHADEELYRNIDLDDVLQALVDAAVRILPADKGALMVWDERGERLTVRATRGFKPETIPLLTFAPGEGVAGIVGMTGEPVCISDVDADARVSRLITDPEEIRAFLHVPIKVGGEIFGVFSADYTEPRPIGEAEVRVLTSLAERAALAIQNAQIFERSQAQAIVEERSRLARDLHDAVTQTLFSASLLADALPGTFDTDPAEGRSMLAELRQLNRGALAEMRALLLELRPSALAEANLEDLLRQLGEAAAGREGIPVRVEVEYACPECPVRPLPTDVHIGLYRIAQEALNNALRHAHAARISICLQRFPNGFATENSGVSLTVRDDGRGFDPQVASPNHFGIGIMGERAESIGADFHIESHPGAGTLVSVSWPARRNGKHTQGASLHTGNGSDLTSDH